MNAQLWVCWLMLAAAAGTEVRSERLTMAVSPMQSFAPTTVTVRVHVTPDADNRTLEVVAESGDYYRSSRIQLNGKEAPHTIAVELRSLPGGDYEVRGTLIDEYGHTRASVRTQVIVIGSTGNHELTRQGFGYSALLTDFHVNRSAFSTRDRQLVVTESDADV